MRRSNDLVQTGLGTLHELVQSSYCEGYVQRIIDVASEEKHIYEKFPRIKPAAELGDYDDILEELAGGVARVLDDLVLLSCTELSFVGHSLPQFLLFVIILVTTFNEVVGFKFHFTYV